MFLVPPLLTKDRKDIGEGGEREEENKEVIFADQMS